MCMLLGGREADRFVLNRSNDSEIPNAPCLFWSLCFVKNQMEWGMLGMWRELLKARDRLWRILGISYTVNIDMAAAWIIRRPWMGWERGIITGDCGEPGSLSLALSPLLSRILYFPRFCLFLSVPLLRLVIKRCSVSVFERFKQCLAVPECHTINKPRINRARIPYSEITLQNTSCFFVVLWKLHACGNE